MKSDISIIGLGTMGQNLARNLANHGFKVLGWDRHKEKSKTFIEKYGNDHLSYCEDFDCLAEELQSPAKYLILVPAGEAVDQVVQNLKPFLKKGDVVIDGGNSHYKDTQKRTRDLESMGVHFVGMGISGGEEGALKGPSLMPGGSEESWKILQPILEQIAAKDFEGNPCVTHLGKEGAGHYVKMIHNGIEYGVMQLMAEAYQLLRQAYQLNSKQIAEVFKTLDQGVLKSFLFDIAVPVLRQEDEFHTCSSLVECIVDQAGQKGTGRWASIEALERGVSLPTITMAVFARDVSSEKALRMELSEDNPKTKMQPIIELIEFIPILEKALYASMISCYAQGFDLLKATEKEEGWTLNFAEIARIWEGGCIIRADLLKVIHEAFEKNKKNPKHLFAAPKIQSLLKQNHKAWHTAIRLAVEHDISVPALSSSLMYFEELTTAKLPANFIQGIRDFFGAHTYQRIDREGVFHTKWSEL